jgi:hypothetical protein
MTENKTIKDKFNPTMEYQRRYKCGNKDKAHLPNNENLRITMVSEDVHELMYSMPKRIYFPNLRA